MNREEKMGGPTAEEQVRVANAVLDLNDIPTDEDVSLDLVKSELTVGDTVFPVTMLSLRFPTLEGDCTEEVTMVGNTTYWQTPDHDEDLDSICVDKEPME